MPKARALSLSARIEPPPPDPIAGRPCVLLWSELDEVQHPGKPKRTVANSFLALLGVTADEKAIEDVVVYWGKPLIGVERWSVWHLLRGSGAEPVCKRVAVRGVL